jgi:subtilisin family serine protease
MKLHVALCMAVFTVLFAVPTWGQIQPPDTGKMSWDLYQLVMTGQRKRAAGQEVPNITVLLVTSRPLGEAEAKELEEKGYKVLGGFGRLVLVEAPADYFASEEVGLDTLGFVRNASLPPDQILNGELPQPRTEGTAVIQAHLLWDQGFFGQDIKIAVIDAGFNPENPVLSSMEPAPIYILVTPSLSATSYSVAKGEVGSVSPHGTSCAIIVHDVAPQAQLYLLSYPSWAGPVGWLCALHYAVHHLKVQVVVSAVEFSRPTCHADGTGPLNEAITEILEGTSTLLVLSAGNWAGNSGSDRTHYHATFTDADADGQHDFTAASDPWDRNTLIFAAKKDDRVLIMLEWNAWNVQESRYDLDLYLYDAVYHEKIAVSLTTQYGKDTDPYEMIQIKLPYSGRFAISITDAARTKGGSSQGVSFHLYLYNADGAFSYIEHYTPCSSVREAATHPQVITVGAINVRNGEVRPYSSRGPTGSGLLKPELYAPDGVTGTEYEKFYGTSAAAPYAAGALGLLLARSPTLTRQEALALFMTLGKDTCQNDICPIDLQLALK